MQGGWLRLDWCGRSVAANVSGQLRHVPLPSASQELLATSDADIDLAAGQLSLPAMTAAVLAPAATGSSAWQRALRGCAGETSSPACVTLRGR